MRRIAVVLTLLACVAAPASARAQAVPTTTPPAIPSPGAPTVDPFNPIAPANPTETPTFEPAGDPTDPGFSRNTLYAILGGVLVILLVVGVAITRDARRAAPILSRNRKDEDLAPAEKARRQKTKKDRRKAKAARAARKRTTRQR